MTIFDNLFTGKPENIAHLVSSRRVRFTRDTILSPEGLKSAFTGADGVFHEAAIPSVPRSVKDPRATSEANVTGTLNVLLAARECGVKKVVYASSSSVYGDVPTLPKREDMRPLPRSPYAVSKLAAEQYCQVFSEIYGLETVSLRYFNVFGPRQDPASDYAAVIPKFITRILNRQRPVIYGDGKQTRDFTYVQDVVQANIKAMESDTTGVFNIACHKQTSLIELAEIIMDSIGVRCTPVFEPPRPADVRDSLADIDSAKSAFGYSPQYTITQGLQETISWYKEM